MITHYIKRIAPFYNTLSNICTKPYINSTLASEVNDWRQKMTQILDIQQTISAANGNISLAKELFAMLLEELDSRLHQIESSFKSGDMDILAEHAHKLHGATAYCIVPELREATKSLDHALKDKNYSILNELVKDVLQEIRQLMSKGPNLLEQDWTNA